MEITIIIGQKEALDGTAIVKDMISGTQETVNQDRLVLSIKKILKSNTDMSAKVPAHVEDDEEDI